MSDFIAENNLCGQTLLKIVSKGNAILAKLLKLKDNVPQPFRLDNREDLAKYGELIVDFRYFSGAEVFERKIEQNVSLHELDDEFRDTYSDIVSEFYFVFESIYKYIMDFNKYTDDVQDGLYLQMTLESILWDLEGKQLLAEALYLYGVMLLLVDKIIDGPVRERMITSFYRYSGLQQYDTNVDDVCKLFRSTKKSSTYPTDYFSRVEPCATLIKLLIGRLRSDDIYNQLGSFPLTEHRTTALAGQASMLVIILSFSSSVLQNETSTMREICDKFFHDNFVVPVYMGYSLNLVEFWEGFRAAKSALDMCKTPRPNGCRIKAQLEELKKVLKEGVLVEENILEKAGKVIALLRDCNVTLRWMMLHTAPLNPDTMTKKSRQVRDQILQETKFDSELILSLLLHISQLELQVKDFYTKLLQEKESKWLGLKSEAKERIDELAEVFSGTKPLTRIEKNENLFQWLKTKATQIDSLDFHKLNSSGRKIIELIRALNDMLEYHNLESQVQVKDWVTETTGCLHRMLKTGSINEDTLITLQIISDIGYAWGNLIDYYTPRMQEFIQKDPAAVSKLRAVFLKLSSAMDLPLMRLNQAKSGDLITVSGYYSGELVSYVQKVLQIIPESVFSLLHEIIELQTHSVKELPTRLEKDKVKDYAQLQARQQIARLTHDMSILTEGILMMKSTLVGIIRIDPQVLLERGIRKELLRQLTIIMTTGFNTPKIPLDSKLRQIGERVDGIRRSFEYIGDYVNSNGLQIFQEEFHRLLNFAMEQESNEWRKVKILPFQSVYQSKEIPIQIPTSEDSRSITFLGKLVNELLNCSDSKTTIYGPETNTWYEAKTRNPILTMDSFKLLESAIDIVGLVGLDRLLSFHCVKQLEDLIKIFQRDSTSDLDFLTSFHSQSQPPSKVHQMSFYSPSLLRGSKSTAPSLIMKIGQLQLLRKRIHYQLQVAGSLNAKHLQCALIVANKLATMGLHSNQEGIEEFALEVARRSEAFGLSDPLGKIYLTLKPIQHVSLLLACVSLQMTKRLTFSKLFGSLISRKVSDGIDGFPFVMGLCTFIMQLHPEQGLSFLCYVCQYLNSYIVSMRNSNLSKRDEDLASCFYLIRHFIRYHCRNEYETFARLLLPSFDHIPTLVNLVS